MTMTMTTTTIINPCPFCGSIRVEKRSYLGCDCKLYFVICTYCWAGGPIVSGSEVAEKAWNNQDGLKKILDLRTAPPTCGESSANNDIVARVNPSEFKDLKSEVNAILKAFKNRRPSGPYCVNYADLRCVGVSRVIEEDGGLWWLVEMEEGDDHEFCELVRSKLSERWGNVIVRMEW